MEHGITYDDYLEHYGVKGMKWGVRKKSDRGGSKHQNGSKSSKSSGEKKSKKQQAKEFYTKHKSTINLAAGAVAVAGTAGVGYALKSKQANYGKHSFKSVRKNGSLEMGRTVASITDLHRKQAVYDAISNEVVNSKNFDRDHVLQSLMTKQMEGQDLLKKGTLTRLEQGRLDKAMFENGLNSKHNKVALGLALNIYQNQPNGYDINKAYGIGKRRHAKKG